MGKRSRKKNKKKKWVQRAPDSVLQFGPYLAERFGNATRFSSALSPEEHAALQADAKEASKAIVLDLSEKIEELQRLIQFYDPLGLMSATALTLQKARVEKDSEYEYLGEENFFAPAAEYIQYLIARTMPAEKQHFPTNDQWQRVWKKALGIINLASHFSILRRSDSATEMDESLLHLDLRRLIVRIRRHPYFISNHLESSLRPYSIEIENAYRISTDEMIHGLLEIDRHQMTTVLRHHHELQDSTVKLLRALHAGGYDVSTNPSDEEKVRIQSALASPEFNEQHRDICERIDFLNSPAPFDITETSALPESVLDALAVEPGESVLEKLSGPAHDDLSPFSNSPLHKRPFLKIANRYYFFFHCGFEDHLVPLIEADLLEKLPDRQSGMMRRRAENLETTSVGLLESIIRPDQTFTGVLYPNPEEPDSFAELDALIVVDDILLLAEAKAGGLSPAGSRGAPKSFAADLSKLIVDAHHQSARAARYVRSADETVFFAKDQVTEVCRIRVSDFRHIFRIVITRENLGWIGARIASLASLEPSLDTALPWHVSLDDLRVVAELFQDDEVRFIHYLEFRLEAAKESRLVQHDEVDHLGLYFERNYYAEIPVKGIDRITYDGSFSLDIDRYFMAKVKGGDYSRPTQKMQPKTREFIDELTSTQLRHRFEVGSAVLSRDSEGRAQLEEALVSLFEGLKEGRRRTFRLPWTTPDSGLSVSVANNPQWEDELRRSAVQMTISRCLRWLAVQLDYTPELRIRRVDLITPESFTDHDLTAHRARHEAMVQSRIKAERPGRNTTCPCGSGKKFKLCHQKKRHA